MGGRFCIIADFVGKMIWTTNDIIGLKVSIFTNRDGTSPISLALSCYGLRDLLTEAMRRTYWAQSGRLEFDQMVTVRQCGYLLARGGTSFRVFEASVCIAYYSVLNINIQPKLSNVDVLNIA